MSSISDKLTLANDNVPKTYMAGQSSIKDQAIPHTNIIGYPLSITDSLAGENAINYTIYGNSTHETRSGKNLLPYPYTETTKTVNGITFTDNGDGTITVNGTATADAIFYFRSSADKITLSAETYTMSGCPKGSSSTTYYIGGFSYNMFETSITFTLSATTSDWFYITIKSGNTVNNLIFKPQIEVGSSATSYEQYGVMPSPEYPSEFQSVGDLVTDEASEYYGKYDVPVTVCGKNLLPYPYKDSTKTEKGITFTDNGDGTITINGTATKNATFYMQYKTTLISSGSYTFSASADMPSDKGDIRIVVYDTEMFGKYVRTKDGVQFTVSKPSKMVVNITIKSGATISDLLLKPQLEIGSTATEYEPYIGETKHFYLDEPLRKLGDYADYIDYEQQKVVRNIKEATFYGTETWYKVSSSKTYYTEWPEIVSQTKVLKNVISNRYTQPNITKFDVLYIRNNVEGIETVDDFKTQLAAWNTAGNPLKVYGVLTTPIEESITLAPMPLRDGINNITTGTAIQPSNINLTYYQDINKVITNLTNAILALGGSV